MGRPADVAVCQPASVPGTVLISQMLTPTVKTKPLRLFSPHFPKFKGQHEKVNGEIFPHFYCFCSKTSGEVTVFFKTFMETF